MGDYYLRQRFYDTSTGRFTRRDTYEGSLGSPLSLHKYIYTHNNPINGIDPTGLFLLEESTRQAVEKSLQGSVAKQTVVTLGTINQQMITVAGAVANAFAAAAAASLSVVRTLNRQFGIPVVIWGNDLPETTQHQFKALTFSGYTINNTQGSPGQSGFISPVLVRNTPHKRYWYDKCDPCLGRGKGPDGKTLVCDEYPYASTIQGGFDNYQAGKVSIAPVPAYEQSLRGDGQGGRLGAFYRGADIPQLNEAVGADKRKSVFLNFAFPSLGFSFWLDRQSNPHAF